MASGSSILTSVPTINTRTRPENNSVFGPRLRPRIAKTPPRDTGLETYGYITIRGKYTKDQVAVVYSDVTEYLSESAAKPHSDGVVLSPLSEPSLDLTSIDRACSEYFTRKYSILPTRSAIFPVTRTRDTGYLPLHREIWPAYNSNISVGTRCASRYPPEDDTAVRESLRRDEADRNQPNYALTVHIALTHQTRVIVPTSELSPDTFKKYGVELLNPVVIQPLLIRLNPGDVLIHRSDLGKEFPRLDKYANTEYGLTLGYSFSSEKYGGDTITEYFNGRPL